MHDSNTRTGKQASTQRATECSVTQQGSAAAPHPTLLCSRSPAGTKDPADVATGCWQQPATSQAPLHGAPFPCCCGCYSTLDTPNVRRLTESISTPTQQVSIPTHSRDPDGVNANPLIFKSSPRPPGLPCCIPGGSSTVCRMCHARQSTNTTLESCSLIASMSIGAALNFMQRAALERAMRETQDPLRASQTATAPSWWQLARRVPCWFHAQHMPTSQASVKLVRRL